jgi:hypothetical protein
LCISSFHFHLLRHCGDRNASWFIASAGLRGTLHIGGILCNDIVHGLL